MERSKKETSLYSCTRYLSVLLATASSVRELSERSGSSRRQGKTIYQLMTHLHKLPSPRSPALKYEQYLLLTLA